MSLSLVCCVYFFENGSRKYNGMIWLWYLSQTADIVRPYCVVPIQMTLGMTHNVHLQNQRM